jgi:hypothetical protein
MSDNLQIKRPCERDDLKAIVLHLTYWHVADDGETSDFYDDGDYQGVEQYICENCGMCWMPESPDRVSDFETAWQEALEHLKVKEVL